MCESCAFAQIMRGFRDSEEIVYCNYTTPTSLVPFPIRDCTSYSDKNRPSWDQMEKLAIEVRPSASLKPVGFNRKGTGFVTEDASDDEVIATEDEVVNK